jgi:hypothetical protein
VSGNISKSLDVTVVTANEILRDAKAYWQFDDPSDITKASAGLPLEIVIDEDKGGTPIIPTGTGAVRVPTRSYFIARHGIAAAEGENSVNEYTLMVDLNIPENGVYHTIFQTDLSNSNDADCFINRNSQIGVGASGYSETTIETSKWYRVIITRKAGDEVSYDIYLDGTNILHSNSADSRFAWSPEGVILFGDEDGEDANIDITNIAIWDRALSPAEVSAMGDVK